MRNKENTRTGSQKLTNEPSELIRKYIKRCNLIPFEDHLEDAIWWTDLNWSVEDDYQRFSIWAEDHSLQRYPKLFRYLSFIAKSRKSWTRVFEDVRKVRAFMKVFAKIAEAYQNEVEKDKQLLKIAEREKNPSLLKLAEMQPNSGTFEISYGDSHSFPRSISLTLRNHNSEKKLPGLGKELFELALGFISLRTNNHYAEISFGGFLDAISGTDLRRLKKCLVCSNIFWAYRLNAKFCSKKCSNVYHQRLYQSDEKKRIEYNEKRRRNYAYKKAKKK